MGRWRGLKDSPSVRGSGFDIFNEGTPVRCPRCGVLTLLVHMQEGCPGCKYNPVEAGRRRELARAAQATRLLGAHRVGDLTQRQYERHMERAQRFVDLEQRHPGPPPRARGPQRTIQLNERQLARLHGAAGGRRVA
jgi:hypothetical protein